MAETTSDNYEKLTDENMEEYTKFSKAAHEYVYFLMKKRKQSMQDVADLLEPQLRMIIVGVNSLKD